MFPLQNCISKLVQVCAWSALLMSAWHAAIVWSKFFVPPGSTQCKDKLHFCRAGELAENYSKNGTRKLCNILTKFHFKALLHNLSDSWNLFFDLDINRTGTTTSKLQLILFFSNFHQVVCYHKHETQVNIRGQKTRHSSEVNFPTDKKKKKSSTFFSISPKESETVYFKDCYFHPFTKLFLCPNW